MTDTPQQGEAQPIVFQSLSQYIKDLSFENPASPLSVALTEQPAIGIKVDVGARSLEGGQYEVALKLNAEAKMKDMVLFIAEIEYAGVFIIKNLTPEQLRPALLIEAPRLLFPFARAILGTVTGDAGYPPLLLQPIDFADLYRKNLAAVEAQRLPEGATIN